MAELVFSQQPFMPPHILHGWFMAIFTFLVQNNFPWKKKNKQGTKETISIKYRVISNDDLQIV